MIRIAIINESASLADDLVASWVPALQNQVSQDFAPIWGADAKIVATKIPLTSDWECHILDDADQSGALGYHDLTAAGQPLIKVFVNDSNAAGVAISSVVSHEILEELADPFIDGLVLIDKGRGRGTLYATEVCDPVEGDAVTGQNGVALSNWVTPAYFMQSPPSGSKFDFLGKLKNGAPAMTPGGYINYMPIREGNWNQSYADKRARELSKLFN